MPLDPRIPLQAFAEPQQSGSQRTLARLGDLVELQRLSQQFETSQQQQREQQALAQALQQFPDNPERAIPWLNRQGFPNAAMKLQSQIAAYYKSRGEARTAELAMYKPMLEVLGQLGNAVTPETFPIIRDLADRVDPEYAAILGDQFDESRVKVFRDLGVSSLDRMKQREAAAEALRKGEFHVYAGRILSTPTTPEGYAAAYADLKDDVPASVLQQFDQTFSPEAVQRAAQLSMTPEERQRLALTQRGQDISAETAIRGQDISAVTQRRGQDISAATQRRGQDIGAATARMQGGAGVASDMPSEYQNALSRAILSIPATRRGSIVSTANRLWKEGNKDELAELIRQAAVEGENVDAKNLVRGRMATVATLNDARNILQEMKAAGVPTGIVTGSMEDVARRLGKTTNPKYAEFATRLQSALINYRRAATGVQFSERESAEYARMFPNYRNDLPVNQALIDGLLREMSTQDRVYWESKLGKTGAELVGALPKAAAGSTGGAPKDGDRRPITAPGYPPGAEAEYRNGKWVRVK